MVSRFGGSPERRAILEGFLDFRRDMKQAGITHGFQWLDGSFFEDCEKNHNRPPNDMDLVTFARRPNGFVLPSEWGVFVQANLHLFTRSTIKGKYKCDAFYIDLSLPSEILVASAQYWFGLFSHQRSTYLWKGLVQVSLEDDAGVARHLNMGGSHAPQT